MKRYILVSLLLIGMFGAKAQEISEMQQVIAKHDELMEKMPGLVKLINKLQTATQNSEDKAKYELAIEDLRTANKSMQNWMIGFGKRFDADEMMKGKKLTAQKKEWLQEEKVKVMALDEEINNSIEKGKVLLKD